MDLISDLGTDLAFAFFVEKRFAQTIDSTEAVALIGRVKTLLESTPVSQAPAGPTEPIASGISAGSQ